MYALTNPHNKTIKLNAKFSISGTALIAEYYPGVYDII